jgi:K+-sensing histidine kinase KdpD
MPRGRLILIIWIVGHTMRRFRSIVGVTLCSVIALLASVLFRNTRIEAAIPLFFLLILVAVTIYFGSWAGTVGTILATIVFMELLFEPIYSLKVSGPAQKDNLIWMVLGGIVISNLLSATPPKKNGGIAE